MKVNIRFVIGICIVLVITETTNLIQILYDSLFKVGTTMTRVVYSLNSLNKLCSIIVIKLEKFLLRAREHNVQNIELFYPSNWISNNLREKFIVLM